MSYAGDVWRRRTLTSRAHPGLLCELNQAKRRTNDAADRVGRAHGDESRRRVRIRGESHALEFSHEVKQGEQRPGFTNKVMVKTTTFTVGAVAVQEEIKPHRHHDGAHVFYIVSGSGTMTKGDKTVILKPGMIAHVPADVALGIKAEGGELTLVDFA